MQKNDLKAATCFLLKSNTSSFINIFGLAAGACVASTFCMAFPGYKSGNG